MSDYIFACPNCHQELSGDAAWIGQQIQCPLCQATVTVPQSPAQHAPSPPQARLSLGRSSQPADSATRSKPVYRQLVPPAPKKQNPLVKWGTAAVVLAALGMGAYYGYGWWQQRQETRAATGDAAAQPADAGSPVPIGAEQPPEAAPGPVDPALPVIPPTWTLDVEAAKIPEGRANGMISGTNFVVEAAQLSFTGSAYLLSLRQGAGASADRELWVFLRPKAGQPLTNQTWTVSPDMKSSGVSQVAKRWKTNPKYAPQQKNYSSGYALKLELGQVGDDGIAGKIFVALPDAEQSVVAGVFKAVIAVPGMASPVAAPNQPVMPPAEMPPDPAFQQRYAPKP